MSDEGKPPNRSPGQGANPKPSLASSAPRPTSPGSQRPPRPAPPASPPQRTQTPAARPLNAARVSTPGSRATTLADAPVAKSDVRRRLRAEAENTALNAVSILGDLWRDFQRSDRYFKYKALILGSWIFLSVAGLFVACPTSPSASTDFGAKLTISTAGSTPFYVIRNESKDTWKNIHVDVNDGEYSIAANKVEPDKDLGFGPKQLVGKNGKRAPESLVVNRLEIRTSEGDAVLIRDGKKL